MTRWARANNAHKARPLDSTPWEELKKKPHSGVKTGTSRNDVTADNESHEENKISKGKKKDRFSPKTKNSPNKKKFTFGKTLTEQQKRTLSQLRKQLIKKGETKDKIKKLLSREKSKMNRTLKRREKTCFKCRKNGHVVSECPLKNNSEGFDICFRCGSSEHRLRDCKKNKGADKNDLPFAVCFICSQQGHLSSQCARNSSGIFPKGGSCHNCGSVNHLKKDCPELIQEKNSEVTVQRLDDTNIEDENDSDDDGGKQKRRPSVKKKIVKFK